MPKTLAAALSAILGVIAFGSGLLAGGQIASQNTATIGGTRVPTVHCQEDETIFWTGVDTLDCVHIEAVNP